MNSLLLSKQNILVDMNYSYKPKTYKCATQQFRTILANSTENRELSEK